MFDSWFQLLEALDELGIKLGNNKLEEDRESVLAFSENVARKKSNRHSSSPVHELVNTD